MSGLDIFALLVLLLLIAVAVAIFIFLGMWPGMVAKKRNHPQVDAITVGSWVALIAGGVLWPIVLIWAYVKTPGQEISADNSNANKEGAAS